MKTDKCPLCGGRIINGVCASCGYLPVNENEISALYSFEPSVSAKAAPKPAEEFVPREVFPEYDAEEIYPDIKVRNSPRPPHSPLRIPPPDIRPDAESQDRENYGAYERRRGGRHMNNNADSDEFNGISDFIQKHLFEIILSFAIPVFPILPILFALRYLKMGKRKTAGIFGIITLLKLFVGPFIWWM